MNGVLTNTCNDLTTQCLDAPPNILLVENDLMAQSIAQNLLRNLGCCVEVANCALLVLNLFEPGKYDVIFMDIGLPDLEGTAVARHLRSMEQAGCDRAIIVALSAHPIDAVKKICYQVGMEEVLNKPLSVQKVLYIFQKYLL